MSFLDEAIYERDASPIRSDFGSDREDNNADEEPRDDDKPKTPEKVEHKKVAKRRTTNQPRLNPDKLKGERGIHTIERYFRDINFKGKGHECEDLDNVMKRMELWAHRLFPKFNFDDCLAAIEAQGKKKAVQTYMTKYRNDMLEMDGIEDVQRGSEDEEAAAAMHLAPMDSFDEMDRMISEQLSKTTGGLQHEQEDEDGMVSMDQMFDDLGVRRLDDSVASQTAPPPVKTTSTLTEEQRAVIAENKRKALERLKQRRGGDNETTQIDLS